ncbi:hypothetical protein L2E82_38162 [Cichorium intybus]|uniref:Uncharacterized protein n=1 Tax=Cichorium intybus TaxID=13427 RepID=A0ACB9AJY5_CICIN|nr:hypothetical protein L2E82_38162 [Cichorium intybus]
MARSLIPAKSSATMAAIFTGLTFDPSWLSTTANAPLVDDEVDVSMFLGIVVIVAVAEPFAVTFGGVDNDEGMVHSLLSGFPHRSRFLTKNSVFCLDKDNTCGISP